MKHYVVNIKLVKKFKVYDTDKVVNLINSTEIYVPSFKTNAHINPDYFVENIVDTMYDFYKQYITAGLSLYSKVKRDVVKIIVRNELNNYMDKGRKKIRTLFCFDDNSCNIEISIKEYVC